ncbi:MAG: hypothetical protein A2Y41_09195 [Spirochaetes bacterium GWB1_36_13]|nr:MAG: hypothetical protein A2Y41_09195 [Spirochaetes bacterium GWB1_36_13]
MKQIALIGYRGCGKSTVGTLLAQKLDLPFYSLDQEIEKKEAKSINQIVQEKGWDYFRKIETEVLKSFEKKEGVLDCGGGIIEKETNRRILRKIPLVVFLKASLSVIHERLKDKTDRPSLTGSKDFLKEIQEVYERRIPLYEKTAHFIVEADEEAEDVAEMIRVLTIEENPF